MIGWYATTFSLQGLLAPGSATSTTYNGPSTKYHLSLALCTALYSAVSLERYNSVEICTNANNGLALHARMNLSADAETPAVAFACEICRNTSAGATAVRYSLDIVSRLTPSLVIG